MCAFSPWVPRKMSTKCDLFTYFCIKVFLVHIFMYLMFRALEYPYTFYKIRPKIFCMDTSYTVSYVRESSDSCFSVVVSQWTKMLQVIEGHLQKVGIACCTIKGDIPPKKRMELVEAFNSDPKGPEVGLFKMIVML